MFETADLITVTVTVVLIISCVVIHYEGLSILTRWVAHGVIPARRRIAVIILGQLVLHVSEIALFAPHSAAIKAARGVSRTGSSINAASN